MSARVDVLLLIAAFAAIAMHVVGLAARQLGLDHGFQANTERKRPVFSTFFLAKLALRRGRRAPLSESTLRAALNQLLLLANQASPS